MLNLPKSRPSAACMAYGARVSSGWGVRCGETRNHGEFTTAGGRDALHVTVVGKQLAQRLRHRGAAHATRGTRFRAG